MENTGIDNEFVSTRYGALRVAHFVSIERAGNLKNNKPPAEMVSLDKIDANFAMVANIGTELQTCVYVYARDWLTDQIWQ